MVQVVHLYNVYPTHCHAGLGAIPVREPPGDHQWCHSVYPTPWAPTCCGVLPSWCTFEVASLLAITEEAAIVDVPGAIASAPASAEESAGITPRYRGSHSSGIREASIHNPVLWAKRNVLLRGQMVAYYHG